MTNSSRYTAEYRGGDWDNDTTEWCIVDEWQGWCGLAIHFGLTTEEAIKLVKKLNDEHVNTMTNKESEDDSIYLRQLGHSQDKR